MLDAGSIRELCEHRARISPDGVFCYFEDTAITFGALDTAVNRVANGLAGLGIGPGAHVAVMLPNHPDHVYTLLALAKLGATHVPVNVHLRDLGLRHLIELAEARFVVADARYDAAVLPVLAAVPGVETFVRRGAAALAAAAPSAAGRRAVPRPVVSFESLAAGGAPDPPRRGPEPDHLVAIMYTSGTTGPPKGVMVSDRMCRAAGRTAGRVAGLRPGDVLFVWEPCHHISGVQAVLACLDYGVPQALVGRFTASGFWDQTRRYGATQIHYLGGVLGLLLKQPPRADDADNPVRVAWGAAAPPQLWPLFERRFGVQIRECYGLTEGASFTTLNLDGRVGSVGRAVEYFDVRIVDAEGRPLPAGRVGEIVQREREPGLLTRGYYRDPAATRAALRDGWLHTGDLGHHDEHGYYYFVGRTKDSLRRRGENVSAWEVERVLVLYPGVEECAVIGVPSDLGEDEIKALIRPSAGQRIDPLDLVRFCERHLAYFQVPRYVAFVDAFPKTPTERIRKDQLSRAVDDCWDLERSGYRPRRAT